MTKRKAEVPINQTSALTHNPFAGLKIDAKQVTPTTNTGTAAVVRRVESAPQKPVPKSRVHIRVETKGRAGKAVTRISGLPNENLEAIAARLKKALGCSAIVEELDVLLIGTLDQRAAQWFEQAGDLRAITDSLPKPKIDATAKAPAQTTAPTPARADGTIRNEIRRGQRVAIVLKQDQPTGALTHGIVRDILTNASEHPRGIKVRLESGEIGRVKIVYD